MLHKRSSNVSMVARDVFKLVMKYATFPNVL
jgi:hypothetical protein